jgi:uncharacterized OsmC-like protein
MAMAGETVTVELRQAEDFRFSVEFPDSTAGSLTLDEPAPMGGGAGPSPTQTLGAAIGHCLSVTLLDCLRRARIPVRSIATTVRAERGRNAEGRLRVQKLVATIRAEPVDPADRPRMDRCVSVFEQYCTVSASVRQGIPIETTVDRGPAGA